MIADQRMTTICLLIALICVLLCLLVVLGTVLWDTRGLQKAHRRTQRLSHPCMQPARNHLNNNQRETQQ